MNTFRTVALASAISALSGTVSAGPIDGAVSALGLDGALSTSSGMPSTVSATARGLSGSAPGAGNSAMVGVSVFEYDDRLNAEALAVAVGSGNNTGNASSGVAVAVLSGQDAGNGGVVGVGVLSEGNNGRGGVLSIRALNADEALALGLNGTDVASGGPDMQSGFQPLSGARLNQPLRDALGRDRGLAGSAEAGVRSITSRGRALTMNDDYVELTAFGGSGLANDGIAGVAAITESNNAGNNIAGVAAMSGADSGNGNLVGATAISDVDSGNGNWAGVSALNSGETAQSNGAGLNVSLINDTQSQGGVFAIAVANGVAGSTPQPPVPNPENPDAHTPERGATNAGTEGCAIDAQEFNSGLPGEAGPQLASRFAKPVAPHNAEGCELPAEIALVAGS